MRQLFTGLCDAFDCACCFVCESMKFTIRKTRNAKQAKYVHSACCVGTFDLCCCVLGVFIAHAEQRHSIFTYHPNRKHKRAGKPLKNKKTRNFPGTMLRQDFFEFSIWQPKTAGIGKDSEERATLLTNERASHLAAASTSFVSVSRRSSDPYCNGYTPFGGPTQHLDLRNSPVHFPPPLYIGTPIRSKSSAACRLGPVNLGGCKKSQNTAC